MKKPTFKIYTLGCKVNQYDSGDLSRRLITAGFGLVEKNARLAVINTCCVTKTAIHKSRRMINKARQENPKAKIVVMGCWPQVYRSEAEKSGVDLVWGVGMLDNLVKQIPNKFQIQKPQIKNDIKEPGSEASGLGSFCSRSRYFIKIQDGCEQFCAYCIIPYARGKLRSRPVEEVVEEVKQAVRDGYREVVLCGIHLGLYRSKKLEACLRRQVRSKKSPAFLLAHRKVDGLVGLLQKLITIKDLGRIRLSSIEVTEVSEGLIKLTAQSNKICRHLHIPLQSGSDKILKSMNRPYDAKCFKNKVREIRKAMPNIALATDVIVGFPGETRQDFNQTHNFIKEIQFSRLHVFPFSAHEKTPAADRPDRVKKQEIERRTKKLRELGKKLEAEYKKKFVGQELDVVVERVKSGGQYIGKTEFYFDVEFDHIQMATGSLVGKIIKVKI